MTGSPARLALLAAVAAVLGAVPVRADESRPIPPAAEAWYPMGVGMATAPLRPEGTLHVGGAAGQVTDRTYLRFDVATAARGADVEGVRLTVPVAPDGGTDSPDAAVILVCAVPGGFEDGGGGDPPPVDCDGAPTATLVAGGTPTFVVELSAPAGPTLDVALVPGGGDTWHVAFDSRTREGGQPATVVVSFTEDEPQAAPAPPTPTPDLPPAAPPVLAPVNQGAPPPVVALPDLMPDPVAPGRVIADEADVAAPGAITGVPAGGSSAFRYPVVFGLPLALIVVLGLAGDGLTRPVRLREEAQ